jgi:hypothetical protein
MPIASYKPNAAVDCVSSTIRIRSYTPTLTRRSREGRQPIHLFASPGRMIDDPAKLPEGSGAAAQSIFRSGLRTDHA